MEYNRVNRNYESVGKSILIVILSILKNVCKVVYELLKLFLLPLGIIFGGPKTIRFWLLYGFLFTYVMFAISSYYDPNAFLTVDFVGLFTDTYDFILMSLKNIALGITVIVLCVVGWFFLSIGAIMK